MTCQSRKMVYHHFTLNPTSCTCLVVSSLELTEKPPVQHVEHTPRSPHDDVRRLRLKLLHLVAHVGAPDAGVARRTHVVAQGQDDLLNLHAHTDTKLITVEGGNRQCGQTRE